MKPWITGGPYAAVYIYGVAGATRNRKKVYVHKLVAEHHVAGRKPGNVVHHKVGPASNTRSTLEWVTPSENAKARKFFHDDGKRRVRGQKKVTDVVQPKSKPPLNAPIPPKSASPPPKSKPVASIPKKVKAWGVGPPPRGRGRGRGRGSRAWVPVNEPEERARKSFVKMVEYVYVTMAQFKQQFKKFYHQTKVTPANFLKAYKKSTGKADLHGKMKTTNAAGWRALLLSAMHAIQQNLIEE